MSHSALSLAVPPFTEHGWAALYSLPSCRSEKLKLQGQNNSNAVLTNIYSLLLYICFFFVCVFLLNVYILTAIKTFHHRHSKKLLSAHTAAPSRCSTRYKNTNKDTANTLHSLCREVTWKRKDLLNWPQDFVILKQIISSPKSFAQAASKIKGKFGARPRAARCTDAYPCPWACAGKTPWPWDTGLSHSPNSRFSRSAQVHNYWMRG